MSDEPDLLSDLIVYPFALIRVTSIDSETGDAEISLELGNTLEGIPVDGVRELLRSVLASLEDVEDGT